jgi:hypothetical protein
VIADNPEDYLVEVIKRLSHEAARIADERRARLEAVEVA